jgi:hypothetical protein
MNIQYKPMEDTLEKKHFAVAIVILEAYKNIKMDLEEHMIAFSFEAIKRKKVLIFLDLIKHSTHKWDVERDIEMLFPTTTYLLHLLVMIQFDFDNCLKQLEYRMKKEVAEGIMTKEQYFFHRNTQFELKRVIMRLSERPDYNITYNKDNTVKILYQHCV